MLLGRVRGSCQRGRLRRTEARTGAWPSCPRLFRLLTPFGAQFDSWADTITYGVGLHSYSFKLAACLQGAAALLLLWTGQWSVLCDLAIAWGLVACLEELLIVRVLEEPLTDVKGLWWVLRQRRASASAS